MFIKGNTQNIIVKSLGSKSVVARLSALKALSTLKTKGRLKNGLSMDLFIECLNHEDPDLRCDAARTLGVMKHPDTMGPLIDALKDPEGDVRIEAAESLGSIGNPQAVDSLIKSLLDDETDMAIGEDEFDWDPQWDVQLNAVRALGKIGDPKAIEPFLKILEDDETHDIDEPILQALSQINNDKALEALIGLLKGKNSKLRSKAAAVLGNKNDPRVKTALLSALKDDDKYVRVMAAGALGKNPDEKIVAELTLLLKNPDNEIRASVAEIISDIDHPHVVDHILPLLEDNDENVRIKAVEILSDSGDVSALEKLIELLVDPAQGNKNIIAVALGKIGSEVALSPLIKLAGDSSAKSGDRSDAVYAIGAIGGKDTMEALSVLALDDEKEISFAALLSLHKIKSPESVSALISIIQDEREPKEDSEELDSVEGAADSEAKDDKKLNDAWRLDIDRKKYVIKILGSTQNKDAADALADIAENGIPVLSKEALTSLCLLEDPRAIPDTLKDLNSQSRDDRLLALNNITRIGCSDKEAVDAMKEVALEDLDAHCRIAAIRGLGVLGVADSFDTLAIAIKGEYAESRRAAIVALGALKDKRAFYILLEALFNYENFAHMRAEIAMSLSAIDKTLAEESISAVLNDENQLVNHWIAIEALTDIANEAGQKTDAVV